ncbi:ApeP family dehydratase [Sneathiella sp.]|uniref:ApeP family dehydratase n=1 Tax=Sneathiella sp. TaxID=1964365 RepID=UPI002FE049A3
MQPCPYHVTEILYHAPPMILIDRVIAYDTETVEAEVEIAETTPFLEAGRVPSYVGIEYMAQSIAAYSGIMARNSGGDVRIGYLVSTRNMVLESPYFAPGDRLKVTVRLVYNEAPLAVFDGRIERNEKLVAEARLNVYQP